MKVKTYRIFDSGQFDALVKEVYGEHVQYEFVAAEEAHNYTAVTFNNMTREAVMSEYDAAKLRRLMIGKWEPFMAQTLIHDMILRGVLAPGNYMVEVFW
jgi:hypothetical protein